MGLPVVDVSRTDDLGCPILKLLAEDWMVAILCEIAAGSIRPSDLERRLPQVPHAGLMRRLKHLSRKGVVDHRRTAGLPPRAEYMLTEAGQKLLEIPAAAMHCQQRWFPHTQGHPSAGVWVLGVLADQRTRAIMRALGDGPLGPRDLGRALPNIPHAAITRRLIRLAAASIIERKQDVNTVRYGLINGTRRLVIVPVLAARWEWQHDRPADLEVASDLSGLIHVLAPLAHAPDLPSGCCEFHVDRPARECDIYLTAKGGRLTNVSSVSRCAPDARGRATPQTWCDALLVGRTSRIAVTGNRPLFVAVLGALSGALLG